MLNIKWHVGMTLEGAEKEIILQAFRYFRGVKTTTATALGIAVNTLDAKLKKYKEDGESEDERRERIKQQQADWAYKQRFGHDGKAARAVFTPEPDGFGDFEEGTDPAGGAAVVAEPGAAEAGSKESVGAPDLPATEAGVRVEPAPFPSSQPALPVPKRQEVQGLPPRQNAAGRSGGRR